MTEREKLAELLELNMFIIPAWQCTYMEAAAELIANGVTFAKDTDVPSKIETNVFDVEEIHHNCTVQILRNSVTGEQSIGWWPEEQPPKEG